MYRCIKRIDQTYTNFNTSMHQVAAKLSKGSAEEGSWILGNVLDYNHKMQTYEIQDEDDVSSKYPSSHSLFHLVRLAFEMLA
jgi:hypothetical protein